MYPVFFEGAIEIKKPKDMTDEQCTSIWAKYGFEYLLTMFANGVAQLPPGTQPAVDTDGFPFFLTAWMPNKEDRDNINRGEAIFIKTLSQGLPPMALFTLDNEGANPEIDITPEWLQSMHFVRQDDESYIKSGQEDVTLYTQVYSIQVGNTLYLEWNIDADGFGYCTLTPETWRGTGQTIFNHIETRVQLKDLYYSLTGEHMDQTKRRL